MFGPNPDAVHPNEKLPSVCYIKNVITRPNIEVGAYTYYDDANTGGEDFEAHVTHHYEFIGDKLIIGKFCAIGKGVEFVMNGANHRMASVTTYPFNIFAYGWEKCTPTLDELPLKGDAIIGANAVVASNIPPYTIAAGNPCRVIRPRFSPELTEYLLALRWWDWEPDKIFRNLEALCSGDLEQIRRVAP